MVDATRLFSVFSGAVKKIGSPTGDLFCCGHALLGDDQIPNEGRLLVGGGTEAFDQTPGFHHEHFHGIRDCAIYYPLTNNWTTAALMNPGERRQGCEDGVSGGRWYPTFLTLADGSVFAMSGHPGPCDYNHTNFIPEVFTSAPGPGGSWHQLGSFANKEERDYFEKHYITWYPRIHLLPTGDIISASPIASNTFSISIDRSTWSAKFKFVTSFQTVSNRDKFHIYDGYWCTSALLPLLPSPNNPNEPLPTDPPNRYTTRLLICNAERTFMLDLGDADPTSKNIAGNWIETAPRELSHNPRRIHAFAVLLPTGEVLVCGGIEGVEGLDDSGKPAIVGQPDESAILIPETFNPFSNKWSAPNDPATVKRNYHSVALLLPDGSVWTAGSDKHAGRGINARELRFEIYYPWYFGNPDRPFIEAAPDRVYPRERWPVLTSQASRIRRVAMVRCGSSTHAFDSDQRYIGLRFEYQGSDKLLVEFPTNNNIMVPGFYFIFVINDADLPSYGTITYARPEEHPQEGDK